MARCTMCRNEHNGDWVYSIDEAHLICDACGEQIDTLLNTTNPQAFRSAVNYINTCKEQADDPVVEEYLNELLANNADEVDVADEQSVKEYLSGKIDESEPAPAKPAEPVHFGDSGDYYQKRADEQNADTGSGQAIMTLAVITATIGVIVSIIWAVAVWIAHSRWEPTIGLGFMILIGGIAASVEIGLHIHAFGELVQDTHENKALLKKQVELLEKQVALLKGQPAQATAKNKKK